MTTTPQENADRIKAEREAQGTLGSVLPATDEFWDLLPDLVPQDAYYDDPKDYR